MSKILIFAEKPKVALKLAVNGKKLFGEFFLSGRILTKEYLSQNEKLLSGAIEKAGYLENDKYIISFAKGHLIELYQAKDYDDSYKNWRNIPYQYLPKEFKFKTNKHSDYLYKNLAKLMNRSDVSKIYNAGDADREGEFIFRLIYSQAKCNKPVERIWVSSQTEDNLIKACEKMEPSSKYDNLSDAGYARAISDFVMGALLTAVATVKLSNGKEITNVGRVQTTVISEIVRVELLNRDFKSNTYYNVEATFRTKDGKEYIGTYEEDFDKKEKADNFIQKLNNKKAKISNFEEKNEKVYSPLLFNQTALQMEMSARFGLTPDETLSTHQSLYESGFLTYPRTSSHHIVNGEADDFAKMYKMIVDFNPLAKKHSFNRNNKRIVDDTKVESHGAIIPTYEKPNTQLFTRTEKDLYNTIIKRVIAINYPPAVDNKQSATTNVGEFEFFSTGINEVEAGWREVYDYKTKNSPLPTLLTNEDVEIIGYDTHEVITKPPKRYTLASILSFMETCGKKVENEDFKEQLKNKGLGTDATRSSVLSGLEKNNYITMKGKSIYPTEKAIKLVNVFPVDELKSIEYTAALEYDLYKVSKGEETYEEFLNKIFDLYKLSCEKIKNSTLKVVEGGDVEETDKSLGKCPACGNNIVKREGSYDTFFGCTNYKSGCKFTINKICGKLLTDNQVSKLLKDGTVGPIKGLVKKDKTKIEEAYLFIKDNTETKKKEIGLSFNKPTVSGNNEKTMELKCPCCEKGLLTKKNGKFGEFYSCSEYKNDCKFTINTICGVSLSETQVKNLLKNKKLSDVKGLKNKAGSELSNVSIVLTDKNKVELEFFQNNK